MFSERAGLIDQYALAKLAAVEQMLASEERWCKGALRDRQGRHCLLGALDAAGARQLLAPVVLRAAREVSGKRYWRIESFNDDRRTTHSDILRVLHCARESIAEPALLDAAEPRPHRYAEAWHALRARSASFKVRLAQAAGGPARLSPLPAAVAK